MNNNLIFSDTFMQVLCIIYAFYARFMHEFYAHFESFVKVFSITYYEGYENITGIKGKQASQGYIYNITITIGDTQLHIQYANIMQVFVYNILQVLYHSFPQVIHILYPHINISYPQVNKKDGNERSELLKKELQTIRGLSDIIVNVRRYALAFTIWFTICVLAIWLSLRDYSATPQNLEWTIDASK